MTLTLADYVGTFLYIVTMAAATYAALIDGKRSRTPAMARFHWLTVATLFAGFAVWRITNTEGRIQNLLRGELREGGQYASRLEVQGAVIAVSVVAALLILGWTAWRWRRQPLHRAISGAGALGLLAFSLLRLMSYHPFDQLIYSSVGPFRLNYFIELTLIGAVFYGIWLMMKPSSERHKSRVSGSRHRSKSRSRSRW